MEPAEFAARLTLADEAERERLLREHAECVDASLARALNAIYLEAYAGDPSRALRAAECLALVERVSQDPEVEALAAWTRGMAAIHQQGQMERGVALLGEATDRFTALGHPLDAAARPARAGSPA